MKSHGYIKNLPSLIVCVSRYLEKDFLREKRSLKNKDRRRKWAVIIVIKKKYNTDWGNNHF